MALTQAQIQTAFQNSLGRQPSATELASYTSVSQSGALSDQAIFQTISNSQEADLIADPVIRFYQAAFGRVPDQAGLANAEAFVRAATPTAATYQNLAQQFTTSTEFTNRYGAGTTVDAAFVQSLYVNILGRQGSGAEIAGYTSGSNGYTTRAQVFYAISQSQEAININNTAVNNFELQAAQGTATYTGSLPAPTTSTNNVALTTGVDNLTGTGGNDAYNAILGTAGGADAAGGTTGQAATLNTFDSIQDQGGSADTLNILVTGGTTTLPNVTISGIETININETQAALTGPIDASVFQGATAINQTASVAAGFVNVTGVAAGETIGFSGPAVLGTGHGEVTVAAGVTSETIQLTGVGSSGTLTLHEVSTSAGTLASATINGSTLSETGTTAGILTLATDATALTTLNLGLTSNDQVILGTGNTNLTTLNAASSTGNLTIDLSPENALTTATFGSGNDSISDALNAKTASLITYNAGAGNDTVTLNATGAASGNHAVSISLGAGADTLNLTTAISNLHTPTNDANITANLITVTDFNAGTGGDVLNLAALRTATRDAVSSSGANNEQSLINAATTLKAAVDVVANATTSGHYQVFDYQGSAYVYVQAAGHADPAAGTADVVTAGDGLVKVTGVTVAQLDAGHLTAVAV